jgi:hypothetical protein
MPEAYALSVDCNVSELWSVIQSLILTDVALIEVFGPIGDKGVGDDEYIKFGKQFALIFRVGRVVPMIPLAICTVDVCVCHFFLRRCRYKSW